jgi:hypothetical protein
MFQNNFPTSSREDDEDYSLQNQLKFMFRTGNLPMLKYAEKIQEF